MKKPTPTSKPGDYSSNSNEQVLIDKNTPTPKQSFMDSWRNFLASASASNKAPSSNKKSEGSSLLTGNKHKDDEDGAGSYYGLNG